MSESSQSTIQPEQATSQTGQSTSQQMPTTTEYLLGRRIVLCNKRVGAEITLRFMEPLPPVFDEVALAKRKFGIDSKEKEACLAAVTTAYENGIIQFRDPNDVNDNWFANHLLGIYVTTERNSTTRYAFDICRINSIMIRIDIPVVIGNDAQQELQIRAIADAWIKAFDFKDKKFEKAGPEFVKRLQSVVFVLYPTDIFDRNDTPTARHTTDMLKKIVLFISEQTGGATNFRLATEHDPNEETRKMIVRSLPEPLMFLKVEQLQLVPRRRQMVSK